MNKTFGMRVLMLLFMIAAPFKMMWSQEMNRKFSLTTQIFLDEQQQKKQSAEGRLHAPARRLPGSNPLPEPEQLIASPDTIGGVAYISCVVYLNNVNDLSAVHALGVRVQSTFKEFITANVPVDQLNALADVDNVTMISVAQLMRPSTDVARQLTNVDDLLTQSESAVAQGVSSKYDGTGVVLGIIDTGIDFQHIAFKDKDGNSRIKRAYVYDGTGEGAEYTSIDGLTTDDNTADHGTHTASTAGGSSVIVNKIANDNFEITVTDDHANATYGGMAPGADLYLAGVKNLRNTELMNALQKMVQYADAQGKPLVVSNSWGSLWGPRDGTGEIASVVSDYFGDTHPNHIILFSSANDAGNDTAGEGGGFFVKKNDANFEYPLGTILRTKGYGGNYYQGLLSVACSDKPMWCELYILDNKTGEYKAGFRCEESTKFSDGISYTPEGGTTTTYYTGSLGIYNEKIDDDHYQIYLYSSGSLTSEETDAYTLAIMVYPAEGSSKVNMWAGDNTYFTSHLTTDDCEWTSGTDDMSVSNEATIPDAISVGAYISRARWYNYEGKGPYHYSTANGEGDIARFSSYATAELSPTGEAYPWISGPGQLLVAGVNHYHTTEVNNSSYFGDGRKPFLVVNNASNPYGGMQGTSMSCPAVAGIVAQWLQAARSVGKSLTVNDVKDIMRRTAINDAFTTTGANATHFGQGKIDALAGIQYITDNGISLADCAYNDTKINRNAGSTTKVMLYGRTLWKDGGWNTLCLPFSMTAEQIAASDLAGADIRMLSSASFDNSNGELTLNFTPEAPADGAVTEIMAGTPYIIKWTSGDNLVNPSFTDVTISTVTNDFTSGNVSFIANYDPVPLTAGDHSVLFMGSSNTLYYPGRNMTMGAFRAYFQLDLGGSEVKQFVLNFDGDDEATSIQNPKFKIQNEEDAWYSLDGRKLSGKPVAKGFYIHGGKTVVIK